MKFRSVSGAIICTVAIAITASGCNTTRYVPQGKYLLNRHVVIGEQGSNTFKDPAISPDLLLTYAGHKPNKKVFGQRLSLRFYSMIDTTKHGWWQKLWGEKFGSPPVIYDSLKVADAARQMEIYLRSCGYLNASVRDSVSFKKKKATIYYKVNPRTPYTISHLDYENNDPFVGALVLSDTAKTTIRRGSNFDRNRLDAERVRIATELSQMGFYTFRPSDINYDVDSTWNDNTVSVVMNLNQNPTDVDSLGEPINHPIFRVSRIMVNTAYVDPTSTIGKDQVIDYDAITYKGIEIIYSHQLAIKPEIIAAAVTFSPNSLYDPLAVRITNQNIRELGFNTTLQFVPAKIDSDEVVEVTIPTADGEEVKTTEQRLECIISCTPFQKQGSSQDLEFAITDAYSSLALTLGYQNRNLFRGAETFTVSLRGAYEIRKNFNNSWEYGITTSLSVPRFAPKWGFLTSPNIRQRTTKVQLSYNLQERPKYRRTLVGGTFGYGWTVRNNARFTLNPIDINIVNVPWINADFLTQLENQGNSFLINSYSSQFLAGLSAGYFYSSNLKPTNSGYTIRVQLDIAGNAISLFNPSLRSTTVNDETFYTFAGLRYAQYTRASFEYTGRENCGRTLQIAGRLFVGAGLPYGNSSVLPFERQYFAGGSNSMRGWQIRTLGLGGALLENDQKRSSYIMGDMRIEANLEFRFKVYDWFNFATFFDAGNVWMNSKARTSNDEAFGFKTFPSQIALNTGVGARFDFSFFIVRADLGIKLHNPNNIVSERWLTETSLSKSVFHIAIGLPF